MDHRNGGESRAALKRKKKKKQKKGAAPPLIGGPPLKKPKSQRAAAPRAAAAAAVPVAAAEAGFLGVVDADGDDLDAGAIAAAVDRGGLEDGDSVARRTLRAVLAPVGARRFYDEYFERRALHVRGRPADYLAGWCDAAAVLDFFDRGETLAGRDADVTRYEDGARADLIAHGTPVSGAMARRLFEGDRATVRLRAPQERLRDLRRLCRRLEDEFGSTVGANAYLTAADAQGFAPHWDDVDVFVLQVEGSKKWTVRGPPRDSLKLPRASSPDFGNDDLAALYPDPPVEVFLRPGDVLYLPRGFVHSAATTGEPSLHLTLSAHRNNAWIDLLERLLPRALAKAGEGEVDLRASLPRDYAHFLGLQHAEEEDDEDDEDDDAAAEGDSGDSAPDSDDSDASVAEVAAVGYDPALPRARRLQRARRSAFLREAAAKLKTVLAHALAELDGAADDLANEFVANRLPPDAPEHEPPPLDATSRVHAVSRRDARLVLDDAAGGGVALYHARANGPTPGAAPVACLAFEADDAPAIEALLASHPARPVLVRNLPHAGGDGDRVGVAESLLAEGLLQATDTGTAPADSGEDDA